MTTVYQFYQKSTPKRMGVCFRRLQLVSAAAFSDSHGTNDAQKTMGIITGVLVVMGFLKTLEVPVWVIISAHTAITLGTMCGGCALSTPWDQGSRG